MSFLDAANGAEVATDARYTRKAAMNITLSEQDRAQAIASIQRYFDENLSEEIDTLPAGLLLNFFLEELGPLVYNKAVSDAQARLQVRVSDLGGDLFVDEFQYWPKADAKRRNRR